ncbi:MAG: sugar ABC transporter permease [Ruminococcaceae bacterium]|nr:sugar ABC transporter permease [Oscillospiraceae bacterium]
MSTQRKISTISVYVFLSVLALIWVLPILWVIITSFREESGSFTPYFLPQGYTIRNYINLLTDNTTFDFTRWFSNTLFVSVATCIISTFFVLSVSYAMSRLRFRMRKPLMNIALILGMFPGFMSMIAVYYVLKAFGIEQSLFALILVYSAGAGLGFYVAKGFFDTVPRALDEAAMLDGASRGRIFWKITLPMSKPIIIYTLLTSFTAPWVDYIFASVIMGDNYENYTVALGLFKMLEKEFIHNYYTQFAAGAVIVSIPIAILFISTQKFYVGGVTGGSVKG